MQNEMPIEHEIKLTPSASVQVKLLSSLRTQSLDDVVKTLKNALGIGDFVIAAENVKNTTDDYYDTDDLALFHTHSLLRVRREGGLPVVVVKTLVGQSQGELRRTEFEKPVTEIDLQAMIATGFANVVAQQLPDFREQKLNYRLKVSKERRNYVMERGAEKYRLSLDTFWFTNPISGRTSDQEFEIEIESLNADASMRLRSIKHHLLNLLQGFAFSTGSKYERGVRKFYMDGPQWKQTLSKWNSGLGLNWVGVVLGAIGLVLSAIGLWLTIRSS